MPETEKRRRRNCGSRMRRWALEQQRKPRPNPAARVAAQIALLLSAMAFSAATRPELVLVVASPEPHKAPVPAKPARPPYTRYDGGGWPSRYNGQVPTFSRLLRDIRRSSHIANGDAIQVLKRRADPEIQFWLSDIIRREAWHELAAVIKPGMSDDDIATAMLRAAIVWTQREREKDSKLPGGDGKKTEDEKPSPGNDDDDDNGNKGPK